jgi:hypothetical protein
VADGCFELVLSVAVWLLRAASFSTKAECKDKSHSGEQAGDNCPDRAKRARFGNRRTEQRREGDSSYSETGYRPDVRQSEHLMSNGAVRLGEFQAFTTLRCSPVGY